MPISLRILLVEDHDDSRELLARLLEKEGHSVKGVCSCGEALINASLQAKDGQGFQIVIADIGLPDGDGVDLMNTLSKQYKLATIALTGHGADGDIQRCKEAGVHAHLLKPTRLDELLRALKSITENNL